MLTEGGKLIHKSIRAVGSRSDLQRSESPGSNQAVRSRTTSEPQLWVSCGSWIHFKILDLNFGWSMSECGIHPTSNTTSGGEKGKFDQR